MKMIANNTLYWLSPMDSLMSLRSHLLLSLAATATAIGSAAAQRAQPAALTTFDPKTASALQWRYIGPIGNRVASVVGVPGDANVYYAGAA